MANKTIDHDEKEYKRARVRLEHTLLIFRQMNEDMLAMLDKLPTSMANKVVKKMLGVRRALLTIQYQLDELEDLERQEKKK
jgi:hypothetical protein